MKRILILFTILLISTGCEEKIVVQPTSEKFVNDVSTCYNIFPISYKDSDGDNHGDLNGITESIPMLAEDLNIDCIWLNPIHPSSTYHKYDVDDYYAIDEKLGTFEDFEKLIEVADEYDVKIVIDFVINHSSTKNQLFLDFLNGKNDYYSTKEEGKEYMDSNWYTRNGVEYYASFWEEMPEFNFDNPEVREYFKEVASFWLDKGVSGFRIDAAYHIYDAAEFEIGYNISQKNVEWFMELNQFVKKQDKDAFIVLEVWKDQDTINTFYPSVDSLFNFDLGESISKSIKMTNPKYIYEYLSTKFQTGSVTNNRIESNFITNHDQNRIANGISDEQIKLASNVSLTLPGITWIYYGEELGMTGMKPDEYIREPYKWNDDTTGWIEYKYNNETPSFNTQQSDQNSILNHYKELIELRRINNFSNATIQNTSMKDNILSYELSTNNNTFIVIHNFNKEPTTVTEDGEVIYGDLNLQGFSSVIIKK